MSHARDKIGEVVAAMLLGPMDPNETLESNPSDTYLTGILWPQDSTIDQIEDDGDPDRPNDGESAEQAIPGYRAIRPCSIGITCSFEREAVVSISLEGTARYIAVARKEDSEQSSAYQLYDWKRVPLHYRVELLPDEARTQWRTHEFVDESGTRVVDPGIAIDIKRRVKGDAITLTATLINTAERAKEPELWDAADLFQARLTIRALGSSGPAILARPTISRLGEEDALSNDLLYRDVREFAVGHGVAAEWEDPEVERVAAVATAWLPMVSVKGTDPNGHPDLASIRNRRPNVFAAATLADPALKAQNLKGLADFLDLYGGWIERKLAGRVASFEGKLHDAAKMNLERCETTLARLRRGVEVLHSSESGWTAFALANAAMDAQAQYPAKRDRARPLVWRPFQLAFILLVVPSLVHPKEDADARACMDLLWFPTGGGKTEAYLALTAFEIFLRRLTHASRRESGGVDVLMRYTMRLLTIQQFQRATALITACDQLRSQQPNALGTSRITIGLYAGGDATPNRMEDAVARIREELAGGEPLSTPRQLLECPVCGGRLPITAYSIPHGRPEMHIICPDPGCATSGQPLPVMTVDDVIYANPPSLLIGVVDKFAQLPRRSDVRTIFGLGGQLRPGLIIQDELHLISGPLGSMAGLYEAAIDRLCTVDGVPPKIIGSTATIGRASSQVRALFDRDVLQFPPPGFDAADSFFAIRDQRGPDRRYIGLASAGRSPKFALQAALAAVSQCVMSLIEKGEVTESEADPYWTCVAYFNSLRELGGAHVLVMDDVPRQMQFLATRLQSSVRRFEDYAKELSGRASSREIPGLLLELGQGLGSADPYAAMPVDMVLASNMISVGVDVPRLGLMVVNGQPKSTAEYIQASSRVGRGLPGLVLTIYNFGRPRDLSHFEHFSSYHQALYRSVEATSVTPWAARARDKALHAVFIAIVRNLVAGMLGDKDANRLDASAPVTHEICEYLLRRATAATRGLETSDVRAELDEILAVWARRAQESRAGGSPLNYWEKVAPFGKTAPALMYSAESGSRKGGSGWPTPNSMREVEPSSAYILKEIARSGGVHGGSE